MKTTLGKRIWSAILALVMVASLLSVPVMAEGTEDITDGSVESNVVDVSAEGGDDLGGGGSYPDRSTHADGRTHAGGDGSAR